MHQILERTPNVSHLCLTLQLHCSDTSVGLYLGLHVISPRRVVIFDDNNFLKNKAVVQLVDALADAVIRRMIYDTLFLPYKQGMTAREPLFNSLSAAPTLMELAIPVLAPLIFRSYPDRQITLPRGHRNLPQGRNEARQLARRIHWALHRAPDVQLALQSHEALSLRRRSMLGASQRWSSSARTPQMLNYGVDLICRLLRLPHVVLDSAPPSNVFLHAHGHAVWVFKLKVDGTAMGAESVFGLCPNMSTLPCKIKPLNRLAYVHQEKVKPQQSAT
ncbi:hypothetical protein B0H15DRAFT_1017815 [Mycena belliarum]|uniref:Uncharacterized protein n=1 Tax=Mycena belliarum TaxID=1033014 RepID=A0AAD6UJQ3_9AGAR|nr:hypothetical protein B0H15DRAFT_1017815 [Mycena belliae]